MKVIKKNGGIDYLMYQLAQGNTAEIFDIAVYSKRGVGVGTGMLIECIEDLKRIDVKKLFAFTRVENKLARKFYEKHGFYHYDIPKLYPDGDAIIYIKNI